VATCGCEFNQPSFHGAQACIVWLRLQDLVRDGGAEQVRPMNESIPWLQTQCREFVDAYDLAKEYTAILE